MTFDVYNLTWDCRIVIFIAEMACRSPYSQVRITLYINLHIRSGVKSQVDFHSSSLTGNVLRNRVFKNWLHKKSLTKDV